MLAGRVAYWTEIRSGGLVIPKLHSVLAVILLLAACRGGEDETTNFAADANISEKNTPTPVGQGEVAAADALVTPPTVEAPVKEAAVAPAALPPLAGSASEYCAVNEESWTSGCSVGCTAGWEGSDCPNACTASPPPGYVLVGHRVANVSENNGSHSISVIPADSNYDYKLSIQNAYKAAMDAAGKANDKAAQAALKEEMERSMQVAESMESSHQMIRLTVNASKHGSWFDKKRGWSHHSADMKVRCVVPNNLQQELYKKYGLK